MDRGLDIPLVGGQNTMGKCIDPPIHGILTPYPWYEDPLTHGVLSTIPMVF
jgi:hypothetical protein